MSPNKPIIGLSGGVGAGKSAVADILAELGCIVISSDRLSHEVITEPQVLGELIGWWGEQVRLSDGRPNRAKIAEIIFYDAEQKQRLESLLYPLIAQRRQSMISLVNSQPAIKAIVLDSPLLFESDLDRLCNAIIFVGAERDTRLARVQATRGWDGAELARRESWQKSLEFKRAQADFIVENNGDLNQLRPRVESILARILA